MYVFTTHICVYVHMYICKNLKPGITFAGIAQGFEKWKQPDNIFEKLSLSGIGPAFSVPASQPAQSPVALAV